MLKNKRLLIVLGIVIVFILFIPNISKAANAKISVSSTGEVNKPITVTVSGTGVQWNLTLKVDGKTIATNRELDNYEKNKNISFSGQYTPTSTGNKEVTLEGTVTEYSDGSTVRSFEPKKISVKEANTNNNNNNSNNNNNNNSNNNNNNSNNQQQTKATLTKLVVAGKTYKNPAKSITVKVDNDVTSAKITPTTSNGESYKINKDNPVKLEEGTNTVKITLASGNVYTVYIRRAAKEDETPNIIDETQEQEVKVALKSLAIKGVRSDDEKIELSYTPEFSAEVYEYKMLLDETLSDITKLDIEAVASKEEFTIETAGNEELKDGENIVTITVKSKDGKTTATYKIIVTKEAKVVPISATTVEIEQEIVSPRWNTTQKILITLFTSIIAIMGIVYAVIEYRYTNQKEESGEDIVEYSFGKIGFKKENKEETEDNTENFETNIEEIQEEGFEKIDPEEIMQEDEKMTFEKIEQKDDTEKMQENTDLEFEKIEEEKPRKNKGKHF